MTVLKKHLIFSRYAFVEFANVEDAEKALQASQKLKIRKREVKIQFYEKREKTESVTGTFLLYYSHFTIYLSSNSLTYQAKLRLQNKFLVFLKSV